MKVSKFASRQVNKRVSKLTWKLYFFVFLFLIAGSTACTGSETEAIQTGTAVAPEFEAFYEEYGGRRVFGRPITEAFQATEEGPLLQYFQTVRLEYDSQAGQMFIFPLGTWELEGLTEQIPALVDEDASSRDFPETGQRIQGEFLAFYEAYRADEWLGMPISPQLEVEGQVVQYFENGRLEYHPELPVNEHIQVSFLGQAHFDSEMAHIYRQTLLAQPVPSAGLETVLVEAYVEAPVLYTGAEQIVYITVLTPESRPVTGIHMAATIFAAGEGFTLDLGVTDEQGRLIVPLDVPLPPGEQVELEIVAYSDAGEILGSAMLTFKTWW